MLWDRLYISLHIAYRGSNSSNQNGGQVAHFAMAIMTEIGSYWEQKQEPGLFLLDEL